MSQLEIRNLTVEFSTSRGLFRAVDRLDMNLDSGEILCVVGESGSGKSVSMLALMGLIGYPGKVTADVMKFGDIDLLGISARERRRLVGKDIAMVFQEPMSSLNPCFPIGWQIGEALTTHGVVPKNQVRDRVVELLHQVGIPAPETRLKSFPHQMSGGMNQRVMIAMAIACNPRLLIADEPTTALDVTIQKQILDLLVSLQRERGMGLILITHDMGVVAETAKRVQVMYAGQLVEEQPTEHLFRAPLHPYTAALLDALPERAIGKRRLPTIQGVVPGIDDRPEGCLFNPRCQFKVEACEVYQPALAGQSGVRARCHFPLDAAGRPTNDYPGRKEAVQ